MDTLVDTIFTDGTAEFAAIQSTPPPIDLTDSPLTPDLITSLTTNPSLFVSSPISEHGYFEIQFMLANNFWGCDFSFGNSACGIQIRQGIAHLIDKAKFASTEPSIAGLATAIDNPVPPSNGGLPSPNPCAWDTSFPESGSNCVVGAPGGTAYHLASAAGVNFPWQPALGSLDFCAAAQHFINAGLATGKASNCVLTGISSVVTTHPVNFYIRADDTAMLHFGQSIAQETCALFGQGFVTGCAPFIIITQGPITAFPGFTTSPTGVNLNWWAYTAHNTGIFPFDKSLFFLYNSRFVSGVPAVKLPNGPCSSGSVPSFSAANYVYLCNPSYDSNSSQMETAPCLTATGDPTPGQTTPTFGTCSGTTSLSSISAGYQTEDTFGKGGYTIPVFSVTGAQFAYLSNWARVINGDGAGIPNYFTWLNAYTATPALTGALRQGFTQSVPPSGLSPYTATSPWEYYILRNIYDSLGVTNPLSNGQLINWMTVSGPNRLPPAQLTYPPPPGTIDTFRFTLRNDLFWQDGRAVTSFDVAFSYLSLLANGAFQSGGAPALAGITILGPKQFDINLNAEGPFTLISLSSLTIIPGRYWTGAGATAWDSAVSACTAPNAACYPAQYTLGSASSGPPPAACALTCLFPAADMNADPTKVAASFDPIAAGILVGSGPWECLSSVTGAVGTGCGPPPGCLQCSNFILTRSVRGSRQRRA